MEPTCYLVLNFTVSCAFAGWLSGFYADYYGILTPDVMNTSHTIEVLAAAYIGGRGSLWGGALAAFLLIFFRQLLRTSLVDLTNLTLVIYGLVIYGLLLILVMVYYPGGTAELLRSIQQRLNWPSP